MLAIEGLCLAGKTTLVHALAARLGALAVPEYADLAPLPPWPPHSREEVTAALRHFLRLEQQRGIFACRTPGRLVALDRSPLTLIAHEFGMERSEFLPRRTWPRTCSPRPPSADSFSLPRLPSNCKFPPRCAPHARHVEAGSRCTSPTRSRKPESRPPTAPTSMLSRPCAGWCWTAAHAWLT